MSELLGRMGEVWERVRWSGHPVRRRKRWLVKKVLGLDSEAYAGRGFYGNFAVRYSKGAGAPFMFCASSADGSWQRVWTAAQVREMLDELARQDADVFVFNLKYEIGAILRALHVTANELERIRMSRGEYWVPIRGGAWEVRVYPGKVFQIRRNRKRGHRVLTLWDAHNFFPGGLERVAQDLLGEGKIAQDVSRYTPEYVRENWNFIAQYCLRDAMLTARLMELLIKKVEEVVGVRPQRHYSPAAWAAEVFRALGFVENVWKFWRAGLEGEEVLKYAWAAYSGGKFEMRVKGYVSESYQYDLSSAYPAVIAQLKPLSWAKVISSQLYHPEAEYGLIHCLIEIDPNELGDLPHPVGVWGRHFGEAPGFDRSSKGTKFYPVGFWEAVITKDEYEYLTRNGARVQIIQGIWMYPRTDYELYRSTVELLYKLKESTEDKWIRHVVKLLLNGMYGKFVQVMRRNDGSLEPGLYWNPIHGGVITARVRCWVSELQKQFGSHILAVHTDSVISDIPLPIEKPGLGGWRFERKGEYIGIRSGIYQIGDKVAHQGFVPLVEESGVLRKSTWKEILRRMDPQSTHIQFEQEEIISWMMAGLIADPQAINVFARMQKILSLVDDPKRVSVGPITAGRLLKERIETLPMIVMRDTDLLTDS